MISPLPNNANKYLKLSGCGGFYFFLNIIAEILLEKKVR